MEVFVVGSEYICEGWTRDKRRWHVGLRSGEGCLNWGEVATDMGLSS